MVQELDRCYCQAGTIQPNCPLALDIPGHRRGITFGLTEGDRHNLLGLCGRALLNQNPIGLWHRCTKLIGHTLGQCGKYQPCFIIEFLKERDEEAQAQKEKKQTC